MKLTRYEVCKRKKCIKEKKIIKTVNMFEFLFFLNLREKFLSTKATLLLEGTSR